jgi:acetyltransferase
MAHSIEPLLKPRSVAVVGASRRRGTVGGETFFNLIRSGFTGPVYPVNPTAPVVQSVRAYASVLDIPDPVDLALIVVPAPYVARVLRECATKGVKGAVIISAGFKEVGGQGIEREEELLSIAAEGGMRLIGPNCLGVTNTHPDIRMHATFAGVFPGPGPVSFLSQSGALGVAVLDLAARRGVGLASFVSVGNKCDVSGNDMLEYWEDDEKTQVVLMYLESFGNPRKFVKLARRVGRRKPIVAVKSGRTQAGSRAAASHTGALAGTDVAVEALFRQAGVIRVDTTEELFDTAMVLATQPVPRGRRVAIITNAGGPGILATDACDSFGLTMADLSSATVEALSQELPAEASIANPLDMISSATPERYESAVRRVLADDGVDALLVIFVPPLMVDSRDIARAIRRAARGADKPVLVCYMGTHGLAEVFRDEGDRPLSIPSYRFPEAAAKALARTADYGEWLQVADSPLVPVSANRETAREIVEARLKAVSGDDANAAGPHWLGTDQVARVLGAYGIGVPSSVVVTSVEQAVTAAGEQGYPVVLKVVGDQITHKTDLGGVVLDVRDEDEVRQAYDGIMKQAAAAGVATWVKGVQVQRFVNEGIEAVVGVTHDQTFGPIIMFGLGGTLVELVRDVVFRLHPLTEHDIEDMMSSVRSAKLLHGYRGQPPADRLALKQLLAQVSQMVGDLPELLEMDLNPVKVLPPGQGCVVVDGRIRLEAPPAAPRWSRVPLM